MEPGEIPRRVDGNKGVVAVPCEETRRSFRELRKYAYMYGSAQE